MSNPKEEQEPSMEEILSSIRRIIADEQDEENPDAGHSDNVEDETLDLRAEDQEFEEEDVLDLTDAVEEPDPHQALMAERTDGPDPFAEEEAFDDHEFDEVPDTFVDPEDGLPPESYETAEPFAEPEVEADLEPIEIHRDEMDVPAPVIENDEVETIAVASTAEDDLVSASAASASTNAFARLARAAAGDSSRNIDSANKSVEEFMTDLVKPLLKEWLDENLNLIVERVVEQEVKKLARRAELM